MTRHAFGAHCTARSSGSHPALWLERTGPTLRSSVAISDRCFQLETCWWAMLARCRLAGQLLQHGWVRFHPHGNPAWLPPVIGMLFGMIVGAFVGYLLGVLCLRMRGVYHSLTTLLCGGFVPCSTWNTRSHVVHWVCSACLVSWLVQSTLLLRGARTGRRAPAGTGSHHSLAGWLYPAGDPRGPDSRQCGGSALARYKLFAFSLTQGWRGWPGFSVALYRCGHPDWATQTACRSSWPWPSWAAWVPTLGQSSVLLAWKFWLSTCGCWVATTCPSLAWSSC